MNIKYYRIFLITYGILILSISSIPGDSIPRFVLLSWDKLIHIVEYSILGFLSINTLQNKSKNQIIITCVLCLCFAIIDEVWQSFIPGRFSSAVDVIADGQLAKGEHTFTWNASNLASGAYFISTHAGNDINTQKVMLIK